MSIRKQNRLRRHVQGDTSPSIWWVRFGCFPFASFRRWDRKAFPKNLSKEPRE